MSAMGILVGLLVVAYLGNMLMSGRALRGYGLPSGSEWLILGFVLGPQILGATSSEALSSFEPLLGVTSAWLALVLGAEYGYAGDRHISTRGLLTSIVFAASSFGIVFGIVFAALTFIALSSARDAIYLSLAIGLASCETASYAVRWVVQRVDGSSSLIRLVEDIAEGDKIVPLLGLASLFVLLPSEVTLELTPAHWLFITAGLGILIGIVCSLLLRTFSNAESTWGVLLGAAWLATGIAWRLGVSPLSVLFLLGLTLCSTSRHGPELRRMLARTESAVLLPTLLLAGAMVRAPHSSASWLLLGAAILGRGVARTMLGGALAAVFAVPKERRLPFAAGFWSTGVLTTVIALACALRLRGPLGNDILTACCAMTLAGELVGPSALRKALALSQSPETASMKGEVTV